MHPRTQTSTVELTVYVPVQGRTVHRRGLMSKSFTGDNIADETPTYATYTVQHIDIESCSAEPCWDMPRSEGKVKSTAQR